MFFKGLYEDLGEVPDECMNLGLQLIECAKNQTLDARIISMRYPAFHNTLGVTIASATPDKEWINPVFDRNQVHSLLGLINELKLRCLANTMMYSASLSIMPKDAYIDWHYDMHTRSMVTQRIHIPLVTNDTVSFYGKWFQDPTIYSYGLSPGCIYRLNNRVPHAVENTGDTRVHLIVDYLDIELAEYAHANQHLSRWAINELFPVQDFEFRYRELVDNADYCPDGQYFDYTPKWVANIGREIPENILHRLAHNCGDPEYVELLQQFSAAQL